MGILGKDGVEILCPFHGKIGSLKTEVLVFKWIFQVFERQKLTCQFHSQVKKKREWLEQSPPLQGQGS